MAAVFNTAAAVLDECCRSTEEQQRLAYRELYRPIIWPATFEDAMARHAFRVAICAVARNRARVNMRDTAHPASTLPRGYVPPTPAPDLHAVPTNGSGPYSRATGPVTQLGNWPSRLTRMGLDVKRLAANDRDDAE